jgi:uncharacterized membrane protein (TIGR02234 family)
LTAAVLGAAAAGALALIAGAQTWAEVTAVRRAPLPPVTALLSGADAAPLVPATGLVLLAAALALLAVRGAGRAVVGLLMAVAGGVLAWSGVRALAGGLDAGGAAVPAGGTTTTDVTAAWPLLAALAGVLGIGAGLLVVMRGRSWPAMGRRYERGSQERDTGRAGGRPTRAETDEDRAQAAWKALDRGDDPTVADPPGPASPAPSGHPRSGTGQDRTDRPPAGAPPRRL